MQENLEIQKVLVVSTAHITYADNIDLSHNPCGLIIDKTDYSFLIYVGKESICDYDQSKNEKISNELRKLIQLAQDNNCDYLKIDRDGPIYSNIKTFDW